MAPLSLSLGVSTYATATITPFTTTWPAAYESLTTFSPISTLSGQALNQTTKFETWSCTPTQTHTSTRIVIRVTTTDNATLQPAPADSLPKPTLPKNDWMSVAGWGLIVYSGFSAFLLALMWSAGMIDCRLNFIRPLHHQTPFSLTWGSWFPRRAYTRSQRAIQLDNLSSPISFHDSHEQVLWDDAVVSFHRQHGSLGTELRRLGMI
ncbi:uncharacterized protein BDZ99DRAFT_464708 [Mytilinidion resinicola]|uniref:Uncharacterized protein n=1 Tax=Mytilinidion resinicola TaxID=574789 RepID=A0A6A6YG48_9PEZI|nr:uncharacterized protein BDZ99DRAFT_464708 [Mytilinidion resinicola]KAF2807796.1 hypothetical protein BDZ99DRAFT_464708 [Mytilinidion resinicola]